MIIRLHVVSEQFLWLFLRPGEMPPCLICAYVMGRYMSPHLCFGQHTFLVCLFLMMHTRLNAAYWGFMVCLVEVICYIKTRWQAARLSVKYSGNQGNCSLCLLIVFLISFHFGCSTYTHISIRPSLEFRSLCFTQAASHTHTFIPDSAIRLRVHVSILILARWNLFAPTQRQQQQLSHCHGAPVLSVQVVLIPFCFWNVAEVV